MQPLVKTQNLPLHQEIIVLQESQLMTGGWGDWKVFTEHDTYILKISRHEEAVCEIDGWMGEPGLPKKQKIFTSSIHFPVSVNLTIYTIYYHTRLYRKTKHRQTTTSFKSSLVQMYRDGRRLCWKK